MSHTGREAAAADIDSSPPDRAGCALDLMVEALGLIDENGGPHDIGAHLDLAIHRLREWIERQVR